MHRTYPWMGIAIAALLAAPAPFARVQTNPASQIIRSLA
jgi:hypothetical protein